MLAEYDYIKSQYNDCILLYQVGEFFEILNSDAITASNILGITLTKRGERYMCGVPRASVEKYGARLAYNFKKAIIYAQKSKDGGEIKREITRIFTPGTLLESEYLPDHEPRLIAATDGKNIIAWSDISTGSLFYNTTEDILNTLHKIGPSEILSSQKLEFPTAVLTLIDEAPVIHDLLSDIHDISNDEAVIISMMIKYIQFCMGSSLPLKFFIRHNLNKIVKIDRYSSANIDLFGKNSLFSFLSKDMLTACGKRTLKSRISEPTFSKNIIEERLDSLSKFYDDANLCNDVRNILAMVRDFGRAAIRIYSGRGKGEDLFYIKIGVAADIQLSQILENHKPCCEHVYHILKEPIVDHLEDHVIKPKYNSVLQESHNIINNKEKEIFELARKLRHRYNVNNIKISNNINIGYFMEVQTAIVSDDLIHRQTLSSSIRYTNTDVCDFERRLTQAISRIEALEKEIIALLFQQIATYIDSILLCAQKLGELDLTTTMALVARREGYTRPILKEYENILTIDGGWHPLLPECQPNDTLLHKNSLIWILTAPNMSGKSVFLKQNVIITMMAHMGFFVPAQNSMIGLVDRIFCRIGADDNLQAGQSTFMREMIEVSNILDNATDRSLIIIDELGRGTSSVDGAAIMVSITEYIHNSIKSRAIIATHFHEAIPLLDKLPCISFYTFDTIMHENKMIFTRKLRQGRSTKSFGIIAARMSGIKDEIIFRAEALITQLQKTY